MHPKRWSLNGSGHCIIQYNSSFHFILDAFIKWDDTNKQMIIENTRITSSDRTRNELIGKYVLAKFGDQKNKAFLDEADYADNLIPADKDINQTTMDLPDED